MLTEGQQLLLETLNHLKIQEEMIISIMIMLQKSEQVKNDVDLSKTKDEVF